ncbi:MAG: TolC family protein [Pseudomonadota bacterium]|nr:TolC family protein [Pseudomonadota bacterium]
MYFPVRSAAAFAAAIALAGCTSLPRERGYAQTDDLIKARLGIAPGVSSDAAPRAAPAIPSAPLSSDQAVRLAFVHNPRMREEYARLGIGRAELDEARRIANPSFGYSRLEPRIGNGTQITRSVSLSFTDLLLLPSRKRFAAAELERLQNAVAAELMNLAAEVEIAWFESVSAAQVAAMRDVVGQAAEHSAELAQRFFDAGNISRLQLEQELAAAAQARIAAVRASAANLRARSTLANLIGLPAEADWATVEQLAAPPASAFTADQLVRLAVDQRLDLAAVRQEVGLREDALGVTRRWRWLGTVEVGYEHENEVEGGVLRGPSLSLELPIFNQGQGAVARAQAVLMDARARLDGLAVAVHNDAHLGLARLAVTREIAERYRTLLVPHREAIVARSQEQVNFMLKGVFELILAKQQEYDAYQEYLEAVRDYWTARAELRHVVGGRLPDDGAALEPTIGVDVILPAAAPAAMDHSMHGMTPKGAEREPTKPAAPDPHAGHDMTKPTEPAATDDPHAGHTMPMPAQSKTPTPPPNHSNAPPASTPAESDQDDNNEPRQHDHGDAP